MGMCVDTQAVTRLCHVSVIQVPCPCNITQSHTDMSVHPCSVPRHHHIMVLACLFTYMLCPSTTAAEAEACLCTYMPYPGTVLYVHGHSCSHACAHSAPFCVHTEAKSKCCHAGIPVHTYSVSHSITSWCEHAIHMCAMFQHSQVVAQECLFIRMLYPAPSLVMWAHLYNLCDSNSPVWVLGTGLGPLQEQHTPN